MCQAMDPLVTVYGIAEGGGFSRSGAGLRASMLLCFFGLFFLSFATVSNFSVVFHVRYHDAFSASAATALLLTACIAPAFLIRPR
jgi:hypothetical protein